MNPIILLLYILFAGISTAMNIGGQAISMFFYGGSFAVEISILIGTITGLPLRYILDKRYIFSHKTKNLINDSKLFLLYSSMSGITTLIFWMTEYTFFLLFNTSAMRYLGGVIGLAIGFYIKYKLDKRFVFITPKHTLTS